MILSAQTYFIRIILISKIGYVKLRQRLIFDNFLGSLGKLGQLYFITQTESRQYKTPLEGRKGTICARERTDSLSIVQT